MPGGCRQLPRLAYLVPGDLMLVGKTRGAYSCVSYQSAVDRKQYSTVGWVRSTSLTPVLPTPSPSRADWIGAWIRAGGKITKGPRDRLRIGGEPIYPAAESVHDGVIHATAAPPQTGFSNSPAMVARLSIKQAPMPAIVSFACSGLRIFWWCKTTNHAAAPW